MSRIELKDVKVGSVMEVRSGHSRDFQRGIVQRWKHNSASGMPDVYSIEVVTLVTQEHVHLDSQHGTAGLLRYPKPLFLINEEVEFKTHFTDFPHSCDRPRVVWQRARVLSFNEHLLTYELLTAAGRHWAVQETDIRKPVDRTKELEAENAKLTQRVKALEARLADIEKLAVVKGIP